MDTSGSEYAQPLLVSLNPMSTDLRAQSGSRQPTSIRKRKRSAEHDSSRARKKRKPALDDLHKLLVTYHGLQQMQRELNEQLAVCKRQIAKHKFGSASGKSRRRRGRGRPYPRVKSPLRGVLRVEEDVPTFWGRVGEWLRRWW